MEAQSYASILNQSKRNPACAAYHRRAGGIFLPVAITRRSRYYL